MNPFGNNMDHLAINEVFIDLHTAWMNDTTGLVQCFRTLNDAMHTANMVVSDHMRDATAKVPSDEGDALMHWISNLAWSSHYYHKVLSQWLTDYYVTNAPDMDADTRKRALFWIRQIIEMLSPTNFFWTNPKAVRRFVQSNGDSLVRGIHNWLTDFQRGDGLLELTDRSAFSVGKNLAVTPGRVVYRNHLVEVIQYTAQTPSTWQVPIVFIQPWINKYYIFDLSPQNSFVQYLIHQGFTVFITSWKNPTDDMRHVSFEDYMMHGAMQAITVAREICKSKQVHAAGYCIGGTLLGALTGWLAHENEHPPVADLSLFATLLDFSEPGDLRAFVSPTSLNAIEELVDAEGVLKAHHMAMVFRMLNPGDLVWRYVVNNYFFGEAPPRSDMLFWNSDSTSLPGAMCTFYLRTFYLENRMIQRNALEIGQRPIDLKLVRQPIYAVGALSDHICPWQSTFQTCRLTSGRVRYVLAGEGHITGIVNPPSPWSKKKYWAGAATRRRDASLWLKDRKPESGSWWPDWVAWLKPRSGVQVVPPSLGSQQYPPLGAAPGTYVHEMD